MPKQSRMKKIVQSKSFRLLCIIAIILAITGALEPGAFNLGNAKQILQNLSYIGLFLCGVSCLLISGGIDFSAAASATCGMIIFATLVKNYPTMSWVLAALAALVFGGIAGAINAFFANGLNLMPFICTIGMSSVWSGLAAWYTRSSVVAINHQVFNSLSTAYVFGSPIPWVFVFMVVMVVLYSIILMKTQFGRSVLMAGGNPTAARLAGLNPKRIKSILFINSGVVSALGALIWASQQKMASPAGLISLSPQMTGLTASILGGVAFSGGAGSLGGAFCGMVLVNVLAYSLQTMGLPLWIITLVNGMLLVVALTIDTYAMKRRFAKLGIKSTGGGGMAMPGMSR